MDLMSDYENIENYNNINPDFPFDLAPEKYLKHKLGI